jgi:hypothetical protein
MIAIPVPQALLTRQFSTVPACAFAQTNPSCCDQMLSSTQLDPPMLMAVADPPDDSEESAFESKAKFLIVQDEQKIDIRHITGRQRHEMINRAIPWARAFYRDPFGVKIVLPPR